MLRTKIVALTAAVTVCSIAVAAIRPAFVQEMPQPTDHHKMLQRGVGEFEGTITMFMPGMEPTPARATETVEGFGPFWTSTRFESEFMGAPYMGTGHVGYDVSKSKFVGTWIDNMSSYLSVMEGDYDEAKKTLVMHWEAPDMTGELAHHRSETVRRADGYSMTFYMGEGEGTKHMEIKMKSKTKKPVEAGSDR